MATTASHHDGFAPPAAGLAGRIGPNAVTRLAEALDESVGVLGTNDLFHAAGQLELRHSPPGRMVDERVVTALHTALRAQFDRPAASRIARRAGALTGDYLLANRIPRPVRVLLPVLPAALGARILVRAMERHAWTFAGSGSFAADLDPAATPAPDRAEQAGTTRLRLSIHGCPLCRGASAAQPVCDYFAATFEQLFVRLIHSSARVRETDCRACGAEACRFDVAW